MTFNEKAYILYEYIVGDVPTTNGNLIYQVCRKYGVRGLGETDYEPVFREYNINYEDIARGKKGGRGQHIGKYKNGFKNNKGKMCPVTQDIIIEYMNFYKRTNKNLEQFLAERFYENDVPQQTYQQPVSQQPTYQQQPLYQKSQPSFDYSRYVSSPSSASNKVTNAVVGIIIFAAVCIALYTLFIAPKNDSNSNPYNENDNTSMYNYAADPEISTCHLGVYVTFEGDDSDMIGVDDYILHIGSEENRNKLTVGQMMSGTINVPEGSYKIWVESGNSNSDVWLMNVSGKGGSFYFTCTVGENGCPDFVSTDALGTDISVTRIR